MQRKYFLDNIRWATVLLVLIYHVFYLFNHVAVPGAVINQKDPQAYDAFLYFVYPWMMVLLFLIAGISARYALQKRTARQFLADRVTKLLVPSSLGLFVYQWISGYFNLKIGGALEMIPSWLLYPIFVISGIGPLWFIQTLFIFSLLIVLIQKLDSQDKLWHLCEKTPLYMLILLVFPVWGASQILNLPVLIMYRFGIYAFVFLAGYFIFSHDSVLDALERIRIPAVILAVFLGILYVIHYFGEDYTSAQCLQSFFTNAYLWTAVLAILGLAKACFNQSTPFTQYMTKSSFGLYIVHYPVVIAACYLLANTFNLPVALNYGLALVFELIGSILLFNIFKTIPVIRYLVLGIKNQAVKDSSG